jgi:hypothetical protein
MYGKGDERGKVFGRYAFFYHRHQSVRRIVLLQATIRLVGFFSSNDTLTRFESLANSLSAKDLRLTVQLPTDAPATPICPADATPAAGWERFVEQHIEFDAQAAVDVEPLYLSYAK